MKKNIKTISTIIDVHHHIIPDVYRKELTNRGITKALGVPFPKWNVNTTLNLMDENHIQTAIVSISAPGVYFPNIKRPTEFAKKLSRQTNDFCAKLIADHPGRFGAFATLPLPDIDAALKELVYALDTLMLDGVVLLSNYDGYYLGDPCFEKFFKELNRRKTVVFIHPATPPGIKASHLGLPETMIDVCFDTTRTVFSLIVNGITKKYPNIRFILSHAGGTVPYIAGRVSVTATLLEDTGGAIPYVAEGINMMANIAPGLKKKLPDLLTYYLNFKHNVLPEGPDFFLRRNFYYDTALAASPHTFASLQTLVDSSHILFGSDYVFAPVDAVTLTIDSVRNYKEFNKQDVTAIENKTAVKLFPKFATKEQKMLRT